MVVVTDYVGLVRFANLSAVWVWSGLVPSSLSLVLEWYCRLAENLVVVSQCFEDSSLN